MIEYELPKCRVRVETYYDGTQAFFPEEEIRFWKWSRWGKIGNYYETKGLNRRTKPWAEDCIENFLKSKKEIAEAWHKENTKTLTYYDHPKD